MSADLSRVRSNPLLDFAGVEIKQGGVLLDADFNELVAVVDRRLRAAASDILGRSTVSGTTPDAFKISISGASLAIGKGRLYVDGLLAENHGAASDPPQYLFDPLLAEPTLAEGPIDYGAQAYLPSPAKLPSTGRHLVYLDVWQRAVTHLERPALIEPAVGVETSSRLQTVWQVRLLENIKGAGCETADEDVPGWTVLTAPSTGRLTTGTFDVPPGDDPCELPPSGGYRGLENQTYRVEIHAAANGAATFKWSRENASVGSRVTSIISATELELETLGRDEVLRFNTGDWVEIIDDVREYSQSVGEIRKITVNESARRITVAALPADITGTAPGTRNLRIRRWDQKRKVLGVASDGSTPVFQDLDSGTTGTINVPIDGTRLLLEHGITVSFDPDGTSDLRAGDFWIFAARTADASVELLTNAPPRGIHHHYARLGVWDVDAGTVSDCRTPWPPAHDCGCTQCVTESSHNSGTLTIQAAVDRLRETGGTVCLGVGKYPLREAVVLDNARDIRICGQGDATILIASGAFRIDTASAVTIEDLGINWVPSQSAIRVRTVHGLTLQRLRITAFEESGRRVPAIELGGAVMATTIRGNLINAPYGILSSELVDGIDETHERARVLLSSSLRIEDNVLNCNTQAIELSGRFFHMMATRITGNEISGCHADAITVLGLSGADSSMQICHNTFHVAGSGIVAGVEGLLIEGNKLVAVSEGDERVVKGSGIVVRTGLDESGIDACQILSNQIDGFEEAGVLIAAPARELIVKLNIIQHCGDGIVMRDEAVAFRVSVENNQISDIGSRIEESLRSISGISVLRAESAAIVGNTIRRIGLHAPRASLLAGVFAVGVERLQISGNHVTDVTPVGGFETGWAFGIGVLTVPVEVTISHNHVERESQPQFDGGGEFRALWINFNETLRRLSRIGNVATVRIDPRTTLVMGGGRPFLSRASIRVTASTRGPSASVIGNSLAARGSAPVASVFASGDCLFSDNRCELRGDGNDYAVVLHSGVTIVSTNRVRSVRSSILIGGNGESATVLGNITTDQIDLGHPGAGLPAKWATLNVQHA